MTATVDGLVGGAPSRLAASHGVGAAVVGQPSGGGSIPSSVLCRSLSRLVLWTVHSDQLPPQSLLTLEGGRPRSRAEKKIKKQRRFSFRTAPLTSDPDSPSCDHSVSSGTRSEGEPSGGPHREKETRNAQDTEWMDGAQDRREVRRPVSRVRAVWRHRRRPDARTR